MLTEHAHAHQRTSSTEEALTISRPNACQQLSQCHWANEQNNLGGRDRDCEWRSQHGQLLMKADLIAMLLQTSNLPAIGINIYLVIDEVLPLKEISDSIESPPPQKSWWFILKGINTSSGYGFAFPVNGGLLSPTTKNLLEHLLYWYEIHINIRQGAHCLAKKVQAWVLNHEVHW